MEKIKNVAIVYGSCEKDIQMKAVKLLTEYILEFTDKYPICVKCGAEEKLSDCIKIYVGTKKENLYIKNNSDTTLENKEEYRISVKNNVVIIEGSDDNGVLYGCVDFYNKYLAEIQYTDAHHMCWENPFAKELPDFELCSHPEVENRGIWTWGHVIYDYRSFIDNMLKLKLNTVIIWNDAAPINGKDIVNYAHASGIRVIWGYAWCWDTDCTVFNLKTVSESIPSIIEKYEREYLPLGGDGIYFQSFTEVNQAEIDGVLVAEAVTDFVNDVSERLLSKYRDLELNFGLHAMSVKEKLEYIKNINLKVRIIWEDCGAFPFDYMPHKIDNFDEMLAFVNKITTLRGNDDLFGAVTKGIICLNWKEFEHLDGPACIGISSKKYRLERSLKRAKIWKYVQSMWFTNAEYAAEAVKLMADRKKGKLYITALVEDGIFEEKIMFPIAVYSEILWNPNQDINKMINSVSKRSYVEFA